MPVEKEISYTLSNSYSTLNELTDQTQYVWFVCHGMGYLSRYFLKYFDNLDPDKHYVIAPQAQSKYYVGTQSKHVGASWLTKENTKVEIENVMAYFDAVLERENLPSAVKLIVLGYSQGVSVAARYVARRKLDCHQLVFLSGRVPAELTKEDFAFINPQTQVHFIYGDQDQFLTKEFVRTEKAHFNEVFGPKASITEFEGKHEVRKDLLGSLI